MQETPKPCKYKSTRVRQEVKGHNYTCTTAKAKRNLQARTDEIAEKKKKGVFPRIAHSSGTGRVQKTDINTVSSAYQAVCNDVYEILRVRESPLTVLLGAMHFHWGLAQLLDDNDPEEFARKVKEISTAVQYAEAAAPYVHPKLNALAVAAPGGSTQLSGNSTEIKISFAQSNETAALEYLEAATTPN